MSRVDISQSKVKTEHGTLAVKSAGSGDPALLLIHGNSTSCSVWRQIFAGQVPQQRRVLAFDLPGHGESSDAPNPDMSYTQPGFAKAAVAVLESCGITSFVVLGWSLGGHIGIEMMPLCQGSGINMKGLMIVGTPPIPKGDVGAGFLNNSHMNAAFREQLTNDEKDEFSHATAGPPYEEWMSDNVYRTDGRFRRIMFDAMNQGRQLDQQSVVESSTVPLAVVNGKDEPYINLNFVSSVQYKNLWNKKCYEMEGLGHAPFWESPEQFETILLDFLKEVGG